jgi:hypothetical protein
MSFYSIPPEKFEAIRTAFLDNQENLVNMRPISCNCSRRLADAFYQTHPNEENMIIFQPEFLQAVLDRVRDIDADPDVGPGYVAGIFASTLNQGGSQPDLETSIIMFPVVKVRSNDNYTDFEFYQDDRQNPWYLQETWIDPSVTDSHPVNVINWFFPDSDSECPDDQNYCPDPFPIG